MGTVPGMSEPVPSVYEWAGGAEAFARLTKVFYTEVQRSRWVALIGLAADDAELPSDPEFRSAFLAYVEWGTRLALANSQPGATPPMQAPVPRWGWGEAPPYLD
jgi:truncated hemoglobin YjbI